jgi:hypothetical protein
MPKPMTMTIDVEEIAFGAVFRRLDTMPGVISINLRGSGPKPAPSSTRRKGGSATVECLILGALVEATKPLSRPDLVAAVTAGGKQASSMPDALVKLKRKSHIAYLKGALYKITKAGRARYAEACAIQQETT